MAKKYQILIIDKNHFLIILLFGFLSHASADEALGTKIDCSEVKINYIDNPEWTHSERLKAMDRAFFESVDRFELCNLSNQSSSSAAANGINQSSTAGDKVGVDSAASQEMSGTETDSTQPSDNSSNTAENTNKQSSKVKIGGGTNGARPKDNPAVDNDDIIAAQIRLAAEIEKDLVKKAKLWAEYRKYKGLAVK